MPNYNYASYLKEAIESILNQTFYDFEFIIIDDSSTDDSVSIIESYTHKDRRIRFYCNEKNAGIASVLNKGIDLCCGEYIALMHSDDISLPDRLKKQISFLKSKNFDLCGGRMITFNGVAEEEGFDMPKTAEEIAAILPFVGPIGHPTVMGKTDLFKKYRYRDFERCEDYDLWIRMIAGHVKITNVPDVVLKYRLHPYPYKAYSSNCEVIVSGLRVKALEIIGMPCTHQERDIHFRMLQDNQLHNSLELLKVFFWFRKLLKFTIRGKPSKIVTYFYHFHFRLVMVRNISTCRIAWSLYRVTKKIRRFFTSIFS